MSLLHYWLTGLVVNTLVAHIHWLIYASKERPDEYYRHTIFEPDIMFRSGFLLIPILAINIIVFILWQFLFPVVTLYELVMIAGKTDNLVVYIDSDNLSRKKQWWRFWRWGKKYMPPNFSPL